MRIRLSRRLLYGTTSFPQRRFIYRRLYHISFIMAQVIPVRSISTLHYSDAIAASLFLGIVRDNIDAASTNTLRRYHHLVQVLSRSSVYQSILRSIAVARSKLIAVLRHCRRHRQLRILSHFRGRSGECGCLSSAECHRCIACSTAYHTCFPRTA